MSDIPTIENLPTNPIKPSLFVGVSPKLAFIFGVVTGVAAVSLIAWILTATAQISFKKTSNSSVAGTVVNNNSEQQANNQYNKPTISLKNSDYVRGNKNAKVLLVEYSDLECPYCKTFHQSMKEIMTQYGDKIAWVYRHFPLSFHANAQKEAEAAECAGKLGGADKYWAYIDAIFARTKAGGTGFALDNLPKLASELGLNQTQFTSCLDSGEFASKVQADLQEGSSYGVSGTPTVFINGQAVAGAVPIEQLKSILDQVLTTTNN